MRRLLSVPLLVGVLLVCAGPLRAVAQSDDPLKMIEEQMGLVKDERVTGYVRAVGARLAEHASTATPLHFFVVDMKEPNAFALEGGHVFVSRGLLAILNSEDELANVMAHEVGHVVSRHHQKQRVRRVPLLPVQIATGIGAAAVGIVSPELGGAVAAVGSAPGALVLATYSRGQENEADEVGQKIVAAAGWDPAAMSSVMQSLARETELHGGDPNRQSFFATHPTSPDRAQRTSTFAKTLSRQANRPIAASRRAFLGEIEGILVGPDGAEGVFVEQRFLHRDLDFSLTFPEGWKTANGRSVVGAVSPDKQSAALLQVVAKGDDPAAGAAQFTEQTKIRLDAAPEALRIGGFPALRATAETGGLLSRTSLVLYWIAHGGHVFQFVGTTPKRSAEGHAPLFARAGESFRRLAPGDRKLITEGRLRLVTARGGERLDAVVARSNTMWSANEAAVANALQADSTLQSGTAVKVAIREAYSPR